jgi:hypothetical protein
LNKEVQKVAVSYAVNNDVSSDEDLNAVLLRNLQEGDLASFRDNLHYLALLDKETSDEIAPIDMFRLNRIVRRDLTRILEEEMQCAGLDQLWRGLGTQIDLTRNLRCCIAFWATWDKQARIEMNAEKGRNVILSRLQEGLFTAQIQAKRATVPVSLPLNDTESFFDPHGASCIVSPFIEPVTMAKDGKELTNAMFELSLDTPTLITETSFPIKQKS